MRKQRLVVLAVLAPALFATAACASPYKMQKIGPQDSPWCLSDVTSISNSGTVLYSFADSGDSMHRGTALWNKSTGTRDITNRNVFDRAEAMNDNGQMTVFTSNQAGVLNPDGTLRSLPGSQNAIGLAGINDSGQVMGICYSGMEATVIGSTVVQANKYVIARWDATGGPTVVSEGSFSSLCPAGINNSGAMAWYGDCTSVAGNNVICSLAAYMWDGVSTKQLPSLFDSILINPETGEGIHVPMDRVYGLNDSGQAAGESGGYAVIWNLDGTIKSLGAGRIYDINNVGQAVGVKWEHVGDEFVEHIVVWNPDGSIDYLDDCSEGASVDWMRINDLGQIAGTVRWGQSNNMAVVFEPVPEPSSVAALVCGFAGMGAAFIRRKRG